MKNSFVLVVIIFLFGCSLTKHFHAAGDNDDIRFQELSHGLYKTTTEKTEQQSNSPSGNYLMTYSEDLIKVTDTIPGQIGVEFGLQYKLVSAKNIDVDLKKVWIFPQVIIDESGKAFKDYVHLINISTNDSNFTSYVFEKQHEIVKGKWTLQLYLKDKMIYEKYFIIK